jgi:hypothetical protein
VSPKELRQVAEVLENVLKSEDSPGAIAGATIENGEFEVNIIFTGQKDVEIIMTTETNL